MPMPWQKQEILAIWLMARCHRVCEQMGPVTARSAARSRIPHTREHSNHPSCTGIMDVNTYTPVMACEQAEKVFR